MFLGIKINQGGKQKVYFHFYVIYKKYVNYKNDKTNNLRDLPVGIHPMKNIMFWEAEHEYSR